MKTITQPVEQIIHSFQTYGLGDIKYNQSKPIAAMILSICFIDQLASFRYNKSVGSNKRWEQFISDYMQEYEGLNIYLGLRNTLVHNYSAGFKYAVSNDVKLYDYWAKRDNVIIINTNRFIEVLERAFNKFILELQDQSSEAYINTQKRSMTHPVLVHAIR